MEWSDEERRPNCTGSLEGVRLVSRDMDSKQIETSLGHFLSPSLATPKYTHNVTTTFFALTPFFSRSTPSWIFSNPVPTTIGSGAGTKLPVARALGRKSSYTAFPTSLSFNVVPKTGFIVTPSGGSGKPPLVVATTLSPWLCATRSATGFHAAAPMQSNAPAQVRALNAANKSSSTVGLL